MARDLAERIVESAQQHHDAVALDSVWRLTVSVCRHDRGTGCCVFSDRACMVYKFGKTLGGVSVGQLDEIDNRKVCKSAFRIIEGVEDFVAYDVSSVHGFTRHSYLECLHFALSDADGNIVLQYEVRTVSF